MAGNLLPLFQRKTFKGIISHLPIKPTKPAAHKTVLQVLPAYYLYLKDGEYSKYTPDDFTGDMKKFGIFLTENKNKDIWVRDVLTWKLHLKTPSLEGEGLSAKTVSRKLTALGNFFSWLVSNWVMSDIENPMEDITNRQVTAPLPEILFETECEKLLAADVFIIFAVSRNRYQA